MIRRGRARGHAGVVWVLVLAGSAVGRADWEPIAPGFDFRSFTAAGPNRLFVVRMDRSRPDVTIDSMIAQGRLSYGTQTVSGMAAAREDTIGYWGQHWGDRYDVVAAINGDFYTDGVPVSGQIVSGWYAKRFGDFTGGSGFAWQLDGDAFIGGCVRHRAAKQVVSYAATGQSQNLDGINRPRGDDELVLYTHHYHTNTLTDDSGAEVLVRMNRPTLILPAPAAATGTVVAIRDGAGATAVPFDHIVLSATGSARATLLANVGVGAGIGVSQEITHYEHDCSTPRPFDWTKTYASIGGSYHFLVGGIVQAFTDIGAIERHPRTAVAFNDDFIFFVVVDGRSGISVGMNMSELGAFCRDALGATEGINQDGGGSSTLWVNGQVVNVPSDGPERPVANGLLMAVVQPAEYSSRYFVGRPVRTTANTAVRLGPGLNHTVRDYAWVSTVGEIGVHELGGVRATGQSWWYCAFDGLAGWVSQNALLEADCAGDYDHSGWVDAADLDPLAACLTGPAAPYAAGHACLAGDADHDRDVDLADVSAVQRCFVEP